ncbi:translation initiation factor Sui1 [Variovorax sp. E3]|jgi:translation initiation factor 1|uniref:translation initiation factor Sui1 n=1 Tax=Variovorax sp. E3 TaxID=1914993 RepID=UPI0018DB9360|nr:translation initiation factor Sui1 [Variovorax sp. E3]
MATTKSNQASTLVYSTEAGGRVCPGCGAPMAQCRCKELDKARVRATDGIVRVSHETKGRKGKGVTVVKGVALDDAGLTALGKQLKTACGSGGTVKDGVIEIQGDHRELVIAALTRLGHTVKRAGG